MANCYLTIRFSVNVYDVNDLRPLLMAYIISLCSKPAERYKTSMY
ncbi:hypothetical protein PQC43_gp120 [Escherichia phage vB_EcoP-101114UKE3]|uniref:Uncharacterized protein n=1 Tax=Escherichia phage vB_EcoP-101114UKE3 TaxID=2865794 RepID=A0AAE8C379_9CAUD|nr:hypothetical protein PQC43_gp120 [Escherichia phage vB_EcoP-101114UKE3]QZI79264.1 hypothetical protein 101114UKE3_133 [Escherichia phage vB_EcoP-101114UKE3]USM81237.1 hypothetical protein 101114BS3_110 [Escherichia phage vB_EcoP-101114BS3]